MVTAMLEQLTEIVIGPELLLLALVSRSELTVAVLAIDGQLVWLDVALRVIVRVLPGERVPKLQVRTPAVIAVHDPAFAPPTVQVRPVGTVSWRVTFVELPVPAAVTVML